MTRLRYVLAVVIALFAVLTLLDRFVLVELLVRRIGFPVLFAVAIALACIGIGSLARRAAERDIPLDFLIGYPLFGTICFLVATLNLSMWTMVPVVAVGAVYGAIRPLTRPSASLSPLRGAREEKGSAYEGLALAMLLLVLACAFVAAQAPPSSLDELAYHLAVPQVWALEGRAVDLPLLSHSYFPLGVESADLPALVVLGALRGGISSHFLHFFAAMATTLLIARKTKSWVTTAAIVTTPALAATAGWSLVDWPLVGLFAALYTADDDDTASAATAAGLLTKYTFIPFAIVVWAFKRRLPKPIALVGLVFFIRNLNLTWNPVAPFLGPDAPHVSRYRTLELAAYVFDGTFVDEAIGASLLALPVFAVGGVALASLAIAVAVFLLAPSARILVPYLVVPAMSAASELRRRGLALLISISIVLQTFVVVWLTARSDAFSLIAGTASDEAYLRRVRPSHASVEWLNQVLPKDSRTLIVGLGETYWFARPVRGGGNFDGPRVSRRLDLPTPEAVRAWLRSERITHVAVMSTTVPTSVARKVEERQMTLEPSAQRMLARTLDRYASSVTSRGDVTLFELNEKR